MLACTARTPDSEPWQLFRHLQHPTRLITPRFTRLLDTGSVSALTPSHTRPQETREPLERPASRFFSVNSYSSSPSSAQKLCSIKHQQPASHPERTHALTAVAPQPGSNSPHSNKRKRKLSHPQLQPLAPAPLASEATGSSSSEGCSTPQHPPILSSRPDC